MNISETHTITFKLDGDEQFVAPLAAYASYRGRRAEDGATVLVNHVKVDVLSQDITAEGAAILVNGGTSGYGHQAQLSEQQIALISEWYHRFVGSDRPHRMSTCTHCGTPIGQTNDSNLADAEWGHLSLTECSTPEPVQP
jgi:hypothetical protein